MTPAAQHLSDWIAARVSAAGARGVALALDGRVESAVVLRLCQAALPDRTVAAVFQPCSAPDRVEAASRLAEQAGVPLLRMDLQPIEARLAQGAAEAVATLPTSMVPAQQSPDVSPVEELRRRARMAALYAVAGALGYLVAGSLTRSDLMVGAFTKFGDGGVDLLPLGAMSRPEARVLASSLGLPSALLGEAPGPDGPGQPQEPRDPGFAAIDLERYLDLGPEGVPPATALRIERLMRTTEHKRSQPAIPE
jgi:NAD+ synthase